MKRGFTLLGCTMLLGLGCGTSSPSNDGGTDAGTGGDTNVGTVNGCTSFTAGTTVTGPSGDTPSQYTPNCISIAKGGSVTWNVDFTAHPLEVENGTSPSPITTTSSGTTVTFTFPNAGTYGFNCQNHPSIMFGAVEVTQ
jgi:plastocyanin